MKYYLNGNPNRSLQLKTGLKARNLSGLFFTVRGSHNINTRGVGVSKKCDVLFEWTLTASLVSAVRAVGNTVADDTEVGSIPALHFGVSYKVQTNIMSYTGPEILFTNFWKLLKYVSHLSSYVDKTQKKYFY